MERVKIGLSILSVLFWEVTLGANTCLAPQNPVPVKTACGYVRDTSGEPLPDVKLQLLNKGTVVTETISDKTGNFMFATPTAGDYELTATSEGWHQVYWPIRISSPKLERVCKHPLEVRLGIAACVGSVTTKGYHPKFSR
jgi:hypothetical protein